MIFAEFYNRKLDGAVRPACGSDSVLPIDGRLGAWRRASAAREVCRKRGFLGFTINAGDYARSHVIRAFEPVVEIGAHL